MALGYRFFIRILAICGVFSVSCGYDSNYTAHEPASATTGFYDAEGIDYTDGGDTRVREALREELQKPTTGKPISHRLKEFEIRRSAKGQGEPSRFGDGEIAIKIFFTDRNAITFSVQPERSGDVFKFNSEAGGFHLSGELSDTPSETKGEFTLRSLGGEFTPARIFYRAYLGKLNVRADQNRAIPYGPLAERQMRALKDGAFAWVHNWVVVKGPSFYLVDIVHRTAAPSFTFKGESKRTGEREHGAKTTSATPRTEVSLIGNAEDESRRLFAVKVRENAKDEPEEFLLDVEWENHQNTRSEVETSTEKKSGAPYLRSDLATPMSRRMVKDFNTNRNLGGVNKYISEFQARLRPDLTNFYVYANPFRPMLEKIGLLYDVSPAFAYLTVVESAYFTGGKYEIEAARTSTALGPFQFLRATGIEIGLRVTENERDERRYFMPSACAGARYIRQLAEQFSSGDTTLAILGYYQGYTGAKRFARYDKLARNYKYTYADMDRLAVLPAHMRAYVNKKLAVYFISEDMERFGFKIPNEAPAALPENGTVFPADPILDFKCRTLAEKLGSTFVASGNSRRQ